MSSVTLGKPEVKGAIAEASEAQSRVEGAGLRENMSQTVTKVESYHWLDAGEYPLRIHFCSSLCMTVSFSFFERLTFFMQIID